jgi:hypothetical protein
MPKLILATATLLLGRSSAPAAADGHTAVQSAMHDRTRSRVATRRLRSSGANGPYLDLGPLDLTRRH